MWAGRTFGIFSPVVPAGFPSVVSPSLCMFRGEPFFFFFFNVFLFLPDVDAAKMRGYRSARVPEVCIEFRSWII